MPIKPFNIHLSDASLEDLRLRLTRARLPIDIDNADWVYGVNREYLEGLIHYWRHDFDWRAIEAQINALEHYRTVIDGYPVHFVHRPGKGPDPVPLILSHGWPWCFWDYHELIGPLTDPQAYGGDAADAFDIVLPSLPGFAFSTPLRKTGMNPWRTADLWAQLMNDLGYSRFFAHGGDWGNVVTGQLGHKYADRVAAIHLTGAIPLPVLADPAMTAMLGQTETTPEQALRNPDLISPGIMRPRPLSAHVAVNVNEPQTVAYALNDSPVGLLAWLLQRRYWWSDNTRGSNAVEQAFSKDHLLTLAMIYWCTESIASSARYYAEQVKHPWQPSHSKTPIVQSPTGITFMDHDMTSQARGWTEGYYNLVFTRSRSRGGHFAAAEVPLDIVDDIRDTMRPFR